MKNIATLQAYRALAALIVVFSHVHNISAHYFGTENFRFLYGLGTAGVVFFFVLSGFVMVWAHETDFERPGRMGAYLRKRVIRIYPPYIFVTLLLLPAWILYPGFGHPYHRETMALVKSLLLIPQAHGAHLAVGWTLMHEMLFYGVFLALFLSRTGGLLLIAAWAVAVSVAEASGLNGSFPASFLLSEFNLLFPLGMAAAFLVRRVPWLKREAGRWVFLAGNFFFVLLMFLEARLRESVHTTLVFGAAAFLIVAGSASAPVEAFFRKQKTLLFWGAASYSLYLIHYPAMSLAGKLMAVTGNWARVFPALGFVALTGIALLAGGLLHVCVERPLQRRLSAKPRVNFRA